MRSSNKIRDEDVVEDVRAFFENKNHWVYQYGTASSCDTEVPYHRKQIEVLFERKYFHWVTDRAVNTLLEEGFLQEEKTAIAHFVWRADIRYIKREIKKHEKIIQRYSDPIITKAIGDYAELLFSFLFRILNFEIIGQDTNEYKGIKWTKTEHNLDFILEKDGIAYGVEVKNTLPYMEKEEFKIKLEMCNFFGIMPLLVLRYASGVQFEKVKEYGGFIIVFKTQIYPPGQELLVKDVWNIMRLPVSIWKDIPKSIENRLRDVHDANFKKIHKKV